MATRYRLALPLLLTLAATTADAGPKMQPYCEAFRDVLQNAAADRRQGIPDWSHSPMLVDQWRDAVAFVFDQSRGYNFEEWIDRRIAECWRDSPGGP